VGAPENRHEHHQRSILLETAGKEKTSTSRVGYTWKEFQKKPRTGPAQEQLLAADATGELPDISRCGAATEKVTVSLLVDLL